MMRGHQGRASSYGQAEANGMASDHQNGFAGADHALTIEAGYLNSYGVVACCVRHRGSWRCRSSWSDRCLAVWATAAFVGGRGSRLAAGRTPLAGVAVPAASGSKSTPSSSAHRCSGAAIGRPRSGSCQVPTETGYRTDVGEGIKNAANCDRTGRRAQRRPEHIVVPKVSLCGRAADGQQPTAVGINTTLREA
jgi:hypothetical protein